MKYRIGEIHATNEGYKVEIVEYNNNTNLVVKFPEGNTKRVGYGDLKKGKVKNPLHKSIFNVGYLGEGKYETSLNRIKFDAYVIWVNMLMRCYNKKYQSKNITYIGVSVIKEWHNFQNFAEWFYNKSNYKPGLELDKDILIKGNKVYSPEACSFVPKEINSILHSGKGCYYDNKREKFIVNVSTGNLKSKYVGQFTTEKEATSAYKKEKQKYIKQRANHYKDILSENVYNALINFELK
jgi:hypothetical protein